MAVVLVTGGSSGIGLATVRRLAAAGHRVFAASRHPDRATLPDGTTPLVLDVSAPDAGAAVGTVVGTAGRLDVLVNNAGAVSLAPLEETDDDEARRILEVNLLGPMRLARAAVPIMRDQGGGQIINVTSMNDVLPAPFAGWYSASKAALASASAVLDAEVHAFGISVTVVAPGLFRTAMADQLDSYTVPAESRYHHALAGMLRAHQARVPAAADPDEVAAAIESCIGADRPPARVVVGRDAETMAKLVHDSPADELAEQMRSFVASLEGPDSTRT